MQVLFELKHPESTLFSLIYPYIYFGNIIWASPIQLTLIALESQNEFLELL